MQSEEAQAQRSEWLKRFEIAARVHEQPKVISPIRKLWAVSDLHIEHRENWQWLDTLPSLFSEDGLLVAGDMCTTVTNLRAALTMLLGKFKHVFYCIGNHELWIAGERDTYDDSLEKYLGEQATPPRTTSHSHPLLSLTHTLPSLDTQVFWRCVTS